MSSAKNSWPCEMPVSICVLTMVLVAEVINMDILSLVDLNDIPAMPEHYQPSAYALRVAWAIDWLKQHPDGRRGMPALMIHFDDEPRGRFVGKSVTLP